MYSASVSIRERSPITQISTPPGKPTMNPLGITGHFFIAVIAVNIPALTASTANESLNFACPGGVAYRTGHAPSGRAIHLSRFHPSLPPAVGALYQFLCIPEDAGSELHDSIFLLSFNLSLPLSDLQKPMVARLTMALRFHCVCRFIRLASRSIRRGNSFSIQSRII